MKKNPNRKRIIKDEKEDVFCFCESMETRFEDYTFKLYGQELTRNLELQYCPSCKEKHIPGRSLLQMEAEIVAKVLSLANERFEVPKGHINLTYYDEVDLLYIRYSNTDSVISKGDLEKGVIFGFDAQDNLTGIEIIDFYDKFVDENAETIS